MEDENAEKAMTIIMNEIITSCCCVCVYTFELLVIIMAT